MNRLLLILSLALMLCVYILSCERSTKPDDPRVPLREFVCGDVNGDSTVNILDLTSIINYLYRGYELKDTIAGDVDLIPKVTINDVFCIGNYTFMESSPLQCPIYIGDTVLPVTDDTLTFSGLNVSPGDSIWKIDICLKAVTKIHIISLPLKYSCSTSSIVCDSITPQYPVSPQKLSVGSFVLLEELHSIDTSLSKVLITKDYIYNGISPGDNILATLWFSLTPSTEPQTIIIDTTIYPPSNIVIFSRYEQPETIASVPVIIF